MILICAATEKEIENVKLEFYRKKDIDFLITDVGVMNTTFTLTKFLIKNRKKLDLIILAGIGGGFDESGINVNDICVASSEFLADFGICFKNRIDYFKYNGEEIKIDNEILEKVSLNFPEIKIGNFITVQCVTATDERKQFFLKKLNPICENMEGFAAAFLCEKFNINFLEIRAISNIVGERENWKLNEAIERLNYFLIKLVKYEELFKI